MHIKIITLPLVKIQALMGLFNDSHDNDYDNDSEYLVLALTTVEFM